MRVSQKEWVRVRLPDVPAFWGPQFRSWLHHRTGGDFRQTFMTARRVRYPIYPEIPTIQTPETSMEPLRYEFAFECRCHHCRAEFITASDGRNLKFWSDECGSLWPMPPEQPDEPPFISDEAEVFDLLGNEQEYSFGDHICCPLCEEDVELIHPSRLRGGRTMQLLIETVEVVGDYAGVFHWLARKVVDEYGEHVHIDPRYAYIVSPNGGLWKYSHVVGGGFIAQRQADDWRSCSATSDQTEAVYHSWGSLNNRRSGGWLYPHIPDLSGTTAEKTGLWMFWHTGNMRAVNYLKIWRHHPYLENLLQAGFSRMVSGLATRPYLLGLYTADPLLNTEARKPHEVLGMSRADFREIRKKPDVWDCEMHRLYAGYCREAGPVSAVAFLQMVETFGLSGINVVKELAAASPTTTLPRLMRYLEAQNLRPDEVRLLLDARNNAQTLAGDRPLTHEELWPRNLIATHDRLAEEVDILNNPHRYQYKTEQFQQIKARLHPLEWTDGDLCIILPESSADLIREGRKLRHCVGGYSDSHCSLRQTIFFVRHYRRPDRSYYTLSMDLRGVPAQNQLHGYGNERHGPQKQYCHKIPRKVLDFVDTWKSTVLMPWYDRQTEEVSA